MGKHALAAAIPWSHPVRPKFSLPQPEFALVVHQDVVARGVAMLDIIELLLLVDVNKARFPSTVSKMPRALDLARLKDDVAVGQDNRPRPVAEPLE